MKIKRFVDTDMRQVLRQVREEQGPDAVILSNRRVDGGIEVISAVDYDEALIQQALRSPAAGDDRQTDIAPEPAARPWSSGGVGRKLKNAKDTVKLVSASLRQTGSGSADGPAVEEVGAAEAAEQPGSSLKSLRSHISGHISGDMPGHISGHVAEQITEQITDMRGMLETQLSSLSWQHLSGRNPGRAQILRNLTRIGIAPDVANIIADRLEPLTDAKDYWRKPLQMLAHTIPVAETDLLGIGGVAALIGPTGVGKTTTIAKIATRYAMQYGAGEVALVSADSHRIGAQEHLSTFAGILGIKVHAAEDSTGLARILDRLRDKKLVLIDTEGTSQRDRDLAARLAAYGCNEHRVHYYLTLSATCQEAVIDETVRVFSCVPLAGAIVTKIDEAAQLGCVLSGLIRHDLPAALLSDGQRVPDDLHPAARKRLWLVNQAVECMRASAVRVDEVMMVERFGMAGGAHA